MTCSWNTWANIWTSVAPFKHDTGIQALVNKPAFIHLINT